MEDDRKKKKKNKKKNKIKQADTTDNAPVAGNGQVSQDAAADDRSGDFQVAGNGKVSEVVADDRAGDVHEANGSQCAALEETIKQLQKEKDLHIQKEATLKDTVKRLQNQNDSLRQKEATLEDTVKRLEKENDSHRQKKATLEDTLKKLQYEIESRIDKEAGLQMEIVQLLSEKDSWLEKEAGLEQKISRLKDEKGTLDSKEASLQEKIECLERDRDAWILKEDSFKQMIATLNNDIARLRAQVLELEQSRNNLVQENQWLMENSSSLQLQIKNLERVSSTPSSDELAKLASEREDLKSQVEEAYPLVEKLMAENAELVEKVNELYVKLDQQSATVELTKTKACNATVVPVETASVIEPMSRSSEDMSTDQNPEIVQVRQEMPSNGNVDVSTLDQKLYSPEVVPIKQEMHSNGDVDSQHAAFVQELPVTDEISEIVQIPLDENEVGNLEMSVENDKNGAVPLIDAPLIGAPFRLMSFVARYVSGADLVNKVPTNS